MNSRSFVILALLALMVQSLPGQSLERRQVSASFIEQEPIIDGVLEESVWKNVPVGNGLVQFQPNIGSPMSEQTEFQIMYSDNSLFIGIRCYDSNPSAIIARRTGRDRSYSGDDYIYFIVDTFKDRRNAYAFAINPIGAQWDALINQNTVEDDNWDGIWFVECRIDDKGWTAEIAIPFSTLDFDPAVTSWGFNLERGIKRKTEVGRWSRPDPDLSTTSPSEAGELIGLTPIKPETKFEFRPFVVAKARRFDGETHTDFDLGADLRYRWSPSLSSTLSINTDFAETEIDSPRINFSRYPLFFEEKREFFLEDNAFYSFVPYWEEEEYFLPFHSRRIGLSEDREVVPLLGAFKTSGRSGPIQVGFTGVYLDEQDNVDRKTVFATRLSGNIGDESRVGFIATAGDPNSNGDNWLGGIDYRYRTSELWGGKNFDFHAFYAATQTDPEEDDTFKDEVFGLVMDFDNEPLSASFEMIEVGENFDPALGFIKKTEVREYAAGVGYKYRPTDNSYVLSNDSTIGYSIETDLDNQIISRGYSLYPIGLYFASGDYLQIGYGWYSDEFDFDWELADNLPVLAGEYENSDLTLSFTSSSRRRISVSFYGSYGDYYGTNRTFLSPGVTFHASSFIEFYLYYYYNKLSSGGQSFETHLTSNTITFKFSPALNWSNTIQYDNVSDFAGWNSRMDWEFQPGSHLYIVVVQSYLVENSSIRVQASQLATKCGLNIRF